MNNLNNNKKGFLALCYHYIRPKKNDSFPRILGNSINQFKNHLAMLREKFNIISLDEVIDYMYSDYRLNENKHGMLLTFDDGLSDHYEAAKILFEQDIKGTFFIPTCILSDKSPANPIIIHYCLADYGVDKFIDLYKQVITNYDIDFNNYSLKFEAGDDPWEVISEIKTIFKYKLPFALARKILLDIYRNTLVKDYSDPLEIMHLTADQIEDMIEMGHNIEVHSHSHISVAATNLNDDSFYREMIYPKEYLEENFNTLVKTISYPFGERKDCLCEEELLRETEKYDLAFTVEKKINTKNTSSFQLGRYMSWSTDDTEKLKSVLNKIIEKGE